MNEMVEVTLQDAETGMQYTLQVTAEANDLNYATLKLAEDINSAAAEEIENSQHLMMSPRSNKCVPDGRGPCSNGVDPGEAVFTVSDEMTSACAAVEPRAIPFDEALDLAGFGRYSAGILTLCSLLLLGMAVDLYGVSVVLPNVACDMRLDNNRKALLSALPLIGVVCMSYVWGLAADTLGRRRMLLLGMGVGFIFSLAASLAPDWLSFCLLKLVSAAFSASANAVGVVYLGELTPPQHRSRLIFIMFSFASFTQLLISVIALPVLPLEFSFQLGALGTRYTSWRLLLQAVSVPAGVGVAMLFFYDETPKFLLSRGDEAGALDILRTVYAKNTHKPRDTYMVKRVVLQETARPDNAGASLARVVWEQTAPLFRPPLLRYTLIIYFMLIVAFTTATSYTMWVPSLTNMYFSDGFSAGDGKTFCEVASRAAITNLTHGVDPQQTPHCGNLVERNTLYAVMVYSLCLGALNLALSFVVDAAGRRRTAVAIFVACAACGAALAHVTSPALSVLLFYCFLCVALIIATVNSYIVEFYPTYLRSMAVCLSVMACRGSSVLGINVIAWLLEDHCTLTIYAFVAMLLAGGLVACLLPPDVRREHPSKT